MTDVLDPDLPDVAELMKLEIFDRIRSTEIGAVTRYDSATGSVSVRPLIARAAPSPTGQRVSRKPSELHEVPVWYSGCGSTRITVAPEPGDYGLILYCHVSTARWKRRGGSVDPGDDRRHWGDDAFFLPGGGPLVSLPTPAPSDAMVLHAGSRVIRIGGPTGTQKTLMGDSFLSALDDLHDALVSAITGLPGGSGVATALALAITAFKVTARAGYKTDKTEVK